MKNCMKAQAIIIASSIEDVHESWYLKILSNCTQLKARLFSNIIRSVDPYCTYTWSYENRAGKPNFLCNFSQLLLSNISLFTVLYTADFGFFGFFFCCFLVRDLCTNRCRHNYHPPPPPPILPCSYVFALTHNSLFNTSDSYSKSVHA